MHGEFRDCATCPEMIAVPAGEFMMGSPEREKGRENSEGPQHQVTIPKPFAVGKYPVTVGQFVKFVQETSYYKGCYSNPKSGSWRNAYSNQSNNHPVVCISWYDALAYVDWLSIKTNENYRLLTEAEWEYVARAGTNTAYHFGDTFSHEQANYDSASTVPVGKYPANAFGLHDMNGNVWEWVEDCWHSNYTGAPVDGSAWLDESGEKRVLRGGIELLRLARRGVDFAANQDNINGFRVA